MKVLKTYVNADGVKVTVYAMAAPRPAEKTWPADKKYSVANLGRKQMTTGSRRVA